MDATFFAVQLRMNGMGFTEAASTLYSRWLGYTDKERAAIAARWGVTEGVRK